MWRNHWDIQDSWQSVTGVIQYFVKNDKQFRSFAGPGGWNDPDMVSKVLLFYLFFTTNIQKVNEYS